MRGLRFLGNSKVEVAELPDPRPTVGEVLVRIRASAICGSELGSFRGPEARQGNDGHEAMGEVVDPNGSNRFRAGDRVGIATLQGCGDCRWCHRGMPAFCDDMTALGNTHSEYAVSGERWLVPLPDWLSDVEGVLISGDGMGVPYGASAAAGVEAGHVTCVMGCGPVGSGMVLMQTHLGARVIAVDVNPTRLELARLMGAWQTINPKETDLVAALVDLTAGLGPDMTFECCGRQETLDAALEATVPGGTIVLVGHGPQQLNPQRLIARKNHRLVGNWMCHFSAIPSIIDAISRGLQARRIVTAEFPLDEAQTAYDRFAAGLEGKVILRP